MQRKEKRMTKNEQITQIENEVLNNEKVCWSMRSGRRIVPDHRV